MERYKPITICVASVLAIGFATVVHEAGHVLAGRMAGGTPTVLTSTEVLGDFTSLSPAGYVALGISGSLVNLAFCALGGWLLRRRTASAELRLTAWFFFAVNGMLVTTAMMFESAVGWGDWMTILHRLPSATSLRVAFTVLGTAGTAMMVRLSGRTLARIVPPGEPRERLAEARRIVLVGAAAAAVAVLGSSIASPVGTTRGVLLALAASLGPFVAIAFGTRFVPRIPSDAAPLVRGGWPWAAAASLTVVVMWFVVGPGIAL